MAQVVGGGRWEEQWRPKHEAQAPIMIDKAIHYTCCEEFVLLDLVHPCHASSHRACASAVDKYAVDKKKYVWVAGKDV